MTGNADTINYSWIGYPSNLPEEEQSSEQVTYGAQDRTIVIRIEDDEDGVVLDIKSTGINSREHLLNVINGVHTVVRQDYLEAQKESRERKPEPAVDPKDSTDGRDVV